MRLPANVLPATVIAAPCLSWAIALAALHGNGSASTYALLFLALPFVLTVGVAFVMGKRAAALPVAFLSAGIGLVSWLFVVVLFASKFAN
jgi:hypothetical protein